MDSTVVFKTDPVLSDLAWTSFGCSNAAGGAYFLQEKFSKYIDFARSIVRALPAEDIPADLADAHMFVKACDLFDGFYHQLGEEDLQDAVGALSGDSEAVNLTKVIHESISAV